MEYVSIPGAYKSGRLIVTPKPPDEVLADMYLRFMREGILDSIFSEGVPGIRWFVETYSEMPAVMLGSVFVPSQNRIVPCGIGWVSKVERIGSTGRLKGEVGMAFTRAGRLRSHALGLLMLEWVFQTVAVESIYGSTPEHNIPAWKYAQQLGFWLSADPVPNYTAWNGEPCGSYVSCMTREMWLKICPQRIEKEAA